MYVLFLIYSLPIRNKNVLTLLNNSFLRFRIFKRTGDINLF